MHPIYSVSHGNYCWAGEAVTRKTRVLKVVYNSTNNELVRTNTLVKGSIIQIDSAPYKAWYLQHYNIDLSNKKEGAATTKPIKEKEEKKDEKGAKKDVKGKKGTEKKGAETKKPEPKKTAEKKPVATSGKAVKKVEETEVKEKSAKQLAKYSKRNTSRVLDPGLADQFKTGRIYAKITSRPGQSGRCDGYILEGEELNFYLKKLNIKKKK